tara:strand:- start:4700 stop:8347 length:3648 start_codon:yes stop_codon:yes gene_type:complete
MSNYEYLFSIKSTKKDLSLNYYFDRIQLKKDISNNNFENYPPYIDNLLDLSYLEFKPNYTFNNYLAFDCNDNSINNVGNIDISLNTYKYIKFIFNRQLTIQNLQFKNNVIGDVSFILWRRLPISENIYTHELSKSQQYVIVGDTNAINNKTIYNYDGVQSYDFIFELIPSQSIPKYICFDTYATNNIFYIDPSNLDISGLNTNVGDPSFILWYTNDRNDCSSIYIDPTTFQENFIKDISNSEIFLTNDPSGMVVRTISGDTNSLSLDKFTNTIDLSNNKNYTIDSSNISIEQLNSLLRDLSGDLINNTQFNGNLIQINNNYPNFTLSFTDNDDLSYISIRSDSKLLTYLNIDTDISYTDTTYFTFKPNNQPKTEIFVANNPGSLNINPDYNIENNQPNDSIVFNKYSNIDIYEKRPIYDGRFNDISNNEPKKYSFLIKEHLNDTILKHKAFDKDIIKYTNESITLDISNVNTKTLTTNNLTFTNINPTDISLIATNGDINTINVKNILFTENASFNINDISISNLNILQRIDVSNSNIYNLHSNSVITDNIILNNEQITINSNDINKSYTNFIDTHYYYLVLDFDNTQDLSITNLKIYDFSNTDVSFNVRELSNNSFYDVYNYDICNNFSASFGESNKTIILNFNEPTFFHKISYKRYEMIFDIQKNLNDTIIYCIDESYIVDDDVNINEYIFKIVIPPGRWTIAEINTLLAETNENNYSLDNSVNVYAYKVNNTLDDICGNKDISLNLSGLKPRNTHFNKFVPFTAAYINSRPVLITAFNYQIHDISGYRQPSDIYTFYKNSTFLEYFFEPNYLVPYDISNNDISGLIPDNFYSNIYHWDIPPSYDTFKRLGYNVISHQHRSENDISNNSYQNILFNLKLPKLNIYGISKQTNQLDISYDNIIGLDIPYDYNTFVYDHYRPVDPNGLFIDYSTNIVDLSDGSTHYDICENSIPLTDSSVNENINYKKLYLEDSSFTDLLINDNKFIYINFKKDLLKLNTDNSYNCLLEYDISTSTLVFNSHVESYSSIFIAPFSLLNYNDISFTDNETGNFAAVLPPADLSYSNYDDINNEYSDVTLSADYLYSYKIETGNLYNLSDDREKFNEKDLSNSIDIVNKIKPYKYYKTTIPYTNEYQFNVNNLPSDAKIESGYIAQDISAIPELNHLVDRTNHLLNLNYNGIQSYLTSALKELNSKINENDILIQQLRDKINILKNK